MSSIASPAAEPDVGGCPGVAGGEAAERAAVALEGEVARVAGVRNAADAALVVLVARALVEGTWQGVGVHTPVQWLMWRAGLCRATARRVVALARRSVELPATMEAFSAGRLSLDQAATVARYTPAAYEASVCELAESATVTQIVRATRRYAFDAEAPPAADTATDGEQDGAAPAEERSVAFGTDEGGRWWARVRLPVDEGVVVEQALEEAREELHRARRQAARAAVVVAGRSTRGTDAELGVAPVSWADALVGVARTALAAGPGGATARVATSILVHLDLPDLPDLPVSPDAAGPPAAPWVGALHLGPRLPDALRRQLTCDGTARVAWSAGGTPVQMGRTVRIVPRRVRRLVEHRDGGCRVPGCDSTLWLEAHHIRHWEDGGPTDTANLASLCGRHHRLHHTGHLGITGNADQPDGLTFTDATGRRLAPAGRPRPPTPADMPRTAPYQGPTGEHLDPHAILFSRTDPPDDARARGDPSAPAA